MSRRHFGATPHIATYKSKETGEVYVLLRYHGRLTCFRETVSGWVMEGYTYG